MIGARKGDVGARLARGWSMNKKIHVGGGGASFPYGGIFSMWAVFSLHVGAMPFFPCVGGGGGGGLIFCMGGGGVGRHYWACPHNNFCGSLLLSQIFLIFPNRGGLNFFGGSYSIHPKNSPPPAPAPITINNLCPPSIVSISASHITIIIL